MKTFSGICVAVLTAAVSAQPQCSPNPTPGYKNCKGGFYVNGRGSDALWCMSEDDCFKVFPGYEPNLASEPWKPEAKIDPAPPAPAERESKVDGVQEAVSAASSVTAASALVAASAVAAILC
mmetsp:Transcript_557/g.1372  ORF Transcript_557/g.1372 Transcript_557/m.1372 type:complete len:122 (+) Transcript_557:59-424(+)|eukprot:CAMPEP_0172368418 /NCGR_PEP_ID=MMETSP1060-20121228/27072_1 /TAXON_ID=37318 /ORGANISM="Pseudo-nitzschia pungens, Strain cf. cingulata" /LENGTH=121 /DNA_ID=CAMNT_0013093003 /DNA_START=29 /DNA_END=394 /DNA_ORIENTATION=-